MSSSKYIQAAVVIVKDYHRLHFPSRQWPKQTRGPFPLSNAPELSITPVLNADQATFYQSQVGVLRWCVELGRVDNITEVSEQALFLAMPREGHSEAIFHLFNYLDKKCNALIAFDPTYPDVDMSAFKECNWKAFYGDIKEAIPSNAPLP
jgi:hypothetical protein